MATEIRDIEMEKEIKSSFAYKEIAKIMKAERSIAGRIKLIGEENVSIKPMGSGGIGQVRTINGQVYVQIGCGRSYFNYAPVVNIGHVREHALTGKVFFVECANL